MGKGSTYKVHRTPQPKSYRSDSISPSLKPKRVHKPRASQTVRRRSTMSQSRNVGTSMGSTGRGRSRSVSRFGGMGSLGNPNARTPHGMTQLPSRRPPQQGTVHPTHSQYSRRRTLPGYNTERHRNIPPDPRKSLPPPRNTRPPQKRQPPTAKFSTKNMRRAGGSGRR